MHRIADDVFAVSTLNPNMRIFDAEMPTEYGTSYNSYLVSGTDRVALIDGNHAAFADVWLAQIREVLGERQPDYLILNHTEPDHSGSVAACLEQYPNIILVCSAAAAINIKNITNNTELALQVVKDGDTLNLGGLTLQFVSAPFLHWPDTLFTWLPERRIAFTCDFLGAHYCEPLLFDYRVTYPIEYDEAFQEYYNAIMAPFAPYVRKGLEKLTQLNPETVATSHGPILTKDGALESALELYREWSFETSENTPRKITLFYCSAYGNTAQLALHIAQGVHEALPDTDILVYDLVEEDSAEMATELNSSDAAIIGSPTINRNALPLIWHLLAGADAISMAKRPIALFGSYGWSGEAVPLLAAHLSDLKAHVYEAQFNVQFTSTKEDLAAARRFGEGFGRSLR